MHHEAGLVWSGEAQLLSLALDGHAFPRRLKRKTHFFALRLLELHGCLLPPIDCSRRQRLRLSVEGSLVLLQLIPAAHISLGYKPKPSLNFLSLLEQIAAGLGFLGRGWDGLLEQLRIVFWRVFELGIR
jgi:hypothetical protein